MINSVNPPPHISVNKPAFGLVKPKERVMIIDDFKGVSKKAATDINGDGIPELWHGLKVKGALLSAGSHKDLPEIELKQNSPSIYKLNKIIKEIIKRNNINKNPVHMVNASIGFSLEYSKIREQTELKITPENLHENENKNKLINEINFKYLTGKKFISNIEKLTHKAKFYTVAGDNGKHDFNPLCLANGAKAIGGLNPEGKPHFFSGKHSLIGKNDWAPYAFDGVLIDKEGNPVYYDENYKIISGGEPYGYDLAPLGQKGDGEADIVFGNEEGQVKLSSDNPPDEMIFFKGTSASTPYKLAKDYLARQAGKTEWNPFEDKFV